MNGIHDMGGMHGFGPVVRDTGEPHRLTEWEARVEAILDLVESQGIFNIDEFRHGIEQMQPAHYLRASYFERWLATIEYNLLQKGVLAAGEVDARTNLLSQQPSAGLPEPGGVRSWNPAPQPTPEPPAAPSAPRYSIGEPVRVRNIHPEQHTRMPRYVRGKRGTIHMVHDPEVFPDTHAHARGENPQAVYNVRFEARELWGDSAEGRQTVSIDLWESYLEPATR
jgi:nitrile hydratase